MSYIQKKTDKPKRRNRWICFGLICVMAALSVTTVSAAELPHSILQRGSSRNIELGEEELLKIMGNISENISNERLCVVLNAYSLQGKISYFWGGKSSVIGWDDRWGGQSYVTSAGSRSTGTLRPFGLDCSGYVNWVFNNAAGEDTTAKVGNGTNNQWAKSTAVDGNNAKPGDLAFFADVSHVGIVVGRNEAGRLLVAHCTSSQNNVVVTEAEATGFRCFRTPDIYNDNNFVQSSQQNSLLKHAILSLEPEDNPIIEEDKVYIIKSYYSR